MPPPAPAPESSKQEGGGKKSFRRAHGERRTRGAESMEFEMPKALRGLTRGSAFTAF